jgi:hypothetical protein
MENSTTSTATAKNIFLAKKLNDYMVEHNNELYEYLNSINELRDFIITRSNEAHESYSSSFSEGMPSPNEVCNSVLFRGMENSYNEYIENLLINDMSEYHSKIEKQKNYYLIIKEMVFGCMDIFYEYLDNNYVEVMGVLDEKLILRITEIKNKLN